MQLPDARIATARTAALLTALGVVFALCGGSGRADDPLPTIPVPDVVGRPAMAVPPVPASAAARQDEKDEEPKKDAAPSPPELSLGECIAVALERQPAIQAARKSQESTEAGQRSLNNIGRVGQLLSPDLPVRKEQASRGVIAAAAGVQKAHNDTVHDVTRFYFTAVYARQQERIADDVAAQLEVLVRLAEKFALVPPMADVPVVSEAQLNTMRRGLLEARLLRLQARQGQRLALAVLREAMGADPGFAFVPRDKELPTFEPRAPLTREQVIGMALERRPELALAAAGVDAFRLEVYAQAKLPFRRSVPTLASGADIHSGEVPQAVRGKDYRPGAIAPEMPPQLVGTKYDRVCRAMTLSERAEAVYEKARNLIVLEAETGFIDLQGAGERSELAKQGFDIGNKQMEFVKDNIDNPRVSREELVRGYAMAAKARSDYVEAVYQHLLSLAALERITAGGVRPKFAGRD